MGPKVAEALTIWYFVRPEQYSASLKPDSQVVIAMVGWWLAVGRVDSAENFW